MVKSKVCQITNCEAIVPPRTATAINWYCFDDRVFFFLHFSATLHLPRVTRAARLLVRLFWIKVWEDVSCFPISHRRSFPVAITCKAEAPLTADHHLCESFTRPVTIGWLSVVYVSNSVTVMRARDQPLPCRTTGSPGPQGVTCNYQQVVARQRPPSHTPHHTMVIDSKLECVSNLV